MGVFERVELLAHGGEHIRVPMAETGDRGAARSVDVFLPGLVADHDAAARVGGRIAVRSQAVQHVGHGSSVGPNGT